MRKPTEAIERMRKAAETEWPITFDGIEDVLAYLDSIPEGAVPVVWPADFDSDALTSIVCDLLAVTDNEKNSLVAARVALRAFAAIAPKREKQKVNLWKLTTPHVSHRVWLPEHCGEPGALFCHARHDWVKVGEAEVEE